jgi:chlorite dismutase
MSETPGTACLEGWHVFHLFYRLGPHVDAAAVERAMKMNGRGIERSLAYEVAGHKADIGVVLAGPAVEDLAAADRAFRAAGLEATWSFISLTEVSEYVPPERVAAVKENRLYPPFPDPAEWPVVCFYPMSKRREGEWNWFALSFEDRSRLMHGHGALGRTFAGKVTQVITAAAGLDDWEWGVTLWARRPDHMREIVYKMRFDEVSARYALFGPFYYGRALDAAGLRRLLGG